MNFEQLVKIFKENNSFLITTHVNPDADAIGSEIAIYLILKELNKKIYVINHSGTPYNLLFLDKDKIIEKFNSEKHERIFNEVDVLIGVDFNRSDRMVSMQQKFLNSKALKICIDHHREPEKFTDYEFTDPEYSSTGEIIYDLIKHTNIAELTKELSENIYAAIMTDTGSFRFERTTPHVHRIAAELIEKGVQPHLIYDSIYDQSKFNKIRLLGKALDSMKLHGSENEICYMRLTQETFSETGAVESDTDGFVNFCLTVENVKIGFLFIELKNGFKVSFRSKGKIPINKLAGEFGGGGHTNAAGARFFDKKLDDYLPVILKRALFYLNEK